MGKVEDGSFDSRWSLRMTRGSGSFDSRWSLRMTEEAAASGRPTGFDEDMEYWRRVGAGATVIEDVKSAGTRTRVYINKKKLMAEKGYSIREV